MKRIAYVAFAGALSVAPAHAVTNDHGVVVFTQADALAGNVSPGDAPGFPVTLGVGGSYRLGSNLVVTTLVNGIEVRANEVSIDMAGFTLAGSGSGRNGIASFNRSLRVANGNIRGFTLDGIRTIAPFLTVSQMIVTANGRTGIIADDTGSQPDVMAFARISDSSVTRNGASGVVCTEHCLVESNIVSLNAAFGIYFRGKGGTALGNVSTSNGFYGMYFAAPGGAGNNTVLQNANAVQIQGPYIAMQPNACVPDCPPPP